MGSYDLLFDGIRVNVASPAVRVALANRVYTSSMTGTGAISATLTVQGSDNESIWVNQATISLSGTGTATGTASVVSTLPYTRVVTSNMLGTNAALIASVEAASSASEAAQLPVGGTTGQALVKLSSSDGDADWGTVLTASAIGVSVQAYNSNLTTWAGKTAPSGTPVGTSDTQTLTNKRRPRTIVTLADSATLNVAIASDNTLAIAAALSQGVTIANPTGTPDEGDLLVIRVKSAAAQSVSFGNKFRATEVDLPTATQGSAITERWLFEWDAADSMWDILAINLGA